MPVKTEHSFKKEEISLRTISSLDGSELHTDMSEKLERLRSDAPKIDIPKYPKAPEYKSNRFKRIYSRAIYFGAIVKQRLSRRDYPIISIIVVNNHCNWDCVYCFGDYPNRREKDYTTDELKFLIDSLYDKGVRYVNLHGGETLMRNDMKELSNHIKNKGMYLCIITNGSFFPEKLDDVRIADNVTISIDGTEENNDHNRGKGSFKTALDAVEMLIKEKIPVRVSATLTKHSMNDIGFLAKLAHEKNFHIYFSILFKPLKKAKDCEMTSDEIRATIKEIQKYKGMGYPVFTSDDVLKASYEWPFDFNDKHHATEAEIPDSYRPAHIPCYYSRTKFTVEADGCIYPCFLTTDGSFIPKNWKEVGVDEAIKHVQDTNVCKACPAMSQNDHNLLLGLNLKQVRYIIKDQIKESLGLKNKVSQ